MSDRRFFLLLSFSFVMALVILSGVLIFFERGGSASFDLLGQKFSSSNIGLAVLFVAGLLFWYLLREFTNVQNTSVSTENINNKQQYGEEEITWPQVASGVHGLALELTSAGGFRPDIVIGICGGGVIVADLLAKRLGQLPCLSLWPDRHSEISGNSFNNSYNVYYDYKIDKIIKNNTVRRILLVDDVVYSGRTMQEGVEFLKSISIEIKENRTQIRTAAIFSLSSTKYKPDYCVYVHPNSRKKSPASDRLRT